MKEKSKTTKEKTVDKDKFIEEIVAFVKSEFLRRQKERLNFERQWELNMKFLSGSQYSCVDGRGEIVEENGEFSWQSKQVFNHIAPIIESRLAKFSRVVPVVSVKPRSEDEEDVNNANLAEKLIKEAFKRADMNGVVNQVTAWSETCGTAFYKIVWNNNGGNRVGEIDGNAVYEGDVKIIPVSPFEIFPDSIYSENLSDLKSLIHARAMNVGDIYDKYGVKVKGDDVGIYDLTSKSAIKIKNNATANVVPNSVVVIEYYEKPSTDYPLGRLIAVAGDNLLYYGDLPYKNGKEGEYSFPFVKQESISVSGCFFGTSVIERLIPIQRSFNAVKNRKHEFLNRLSMGIMAVEDGSIDVDDLESDGLKPGKVLVYRQGATPPEMIDESALPPDFKDEEDKLLSEFVAVSGVSDVTSSQQNANLKSGSALELLVSQDNERMTVNAERIRRCYLEVARQVLKLYAQFISGVRVINYQDTFNKTKVCYADGNSAKSDDVYLESENELLYTPIQKKQMLLSLYESGMLNDEEGKISVRTKEKLLALLGYQDLDYNRGMSILHEEKARVENLKLLKEQEIAVDLDDHKIHIDEHVRYFLTEHEDLSDAQKSRFIEHVKSHKTFIGKIDSQSQE